MAEPIVYTPNHGDRGTYGIDDRLSYAADPVLTEASTFDDLARLAESPAWEDRVRAAVLRERLRVTLPDGFPCLYETADSPSQQRHLRLAPLAWVVSPDLDMLTALLPDYQTLWDAHTEQWGPDSRRTFAVGRLDGLRVAKVYRPGTTPEQVIVATLSTHPDMYARAPERLRALHPRHPTQQRAQARASAAERERARRARASGPQ